MNTQARFWNNVEKSDGCWLWMASLTRGYGQFFVDGHHLKAHRYSFQLHYGYLPELVCHTCDNPRCVRPDHLFAGTIYTNIEDRVKKNRTYCGAKPNRIGKGMGERNGWNTHPENRPIGELNPKAKLKVEQILEIRRRRKLGEKIVKLGKDFGVSHVMISDICNRKNWKHI